MNRIQTPGCDVCIQYTYDADADSAFEEEPNQTDEEAVNLQPSPGGSESESD